MSDQPAFDTLLGEARAATEPNQRSNAILRAFESVWKRNRSLFLPNLQSLLAFQASTIAFIWCLHIYELISYIFVQVDPSPSVRKLVVKMADQIIKEAPECMFCGYCDC